MEHIWTSQNYLPLLTTRDILILLEILEFGTKYPQQLIYQNNKRKMYAKEFRDLLQNEFSFILFEDVCEYLQAKSILVDDVTKEMTKRTSQGFYSQDEISQCYPSLDMTIMVYCSTHHSDLFQMEDHTIIWNPTQRLH